MEVPIGFLAKLWSFISFIPFFFLLLLGGVCKAAVIGSVVALLVFVGNSSVIIGLWPAHLLWTYYCLVKTKRLGLVLKVLVLLCLPVLLVLSPVVGILGSLLVGIGYGFFAPLIATFETLGDEFIDKLHHCFTVWDWLFRSCELNGRILLNDGLISSEDAEECITKGKSKKLSISLPAWCILQCLLRSAKLDVNGLLISDGVELTNFTWPKDKVLEWLFGPLLVLKEQIKGLHLDENEESSLRVLIMTNSNERPEDWEGSGFLSDDMVRRAQLQGILRRLQGMVSSLSIMPTFRRRLNNLVKALYVDAIEAGKLSTKDMDPKTKGKVAGLVDERRQNKNTERENGIAELV